MFRKIKNIFYYKRIFVELVFLWKIIFFNLFINNKILISILYLVNNKIFSKFKKGYFSIFLNGEVLPNKACRSIVFIGESYYCFFYLAKALKKRGWKAISVSLTSNDSPSSFLSHGCDLNLYSSDAAQRKKNIKFFLDVISKEYKMIHFYSDFMILDNYMNHIIPLDIIALKNHGVKIGYTPSGCLDACTQSQIYQHTKGLCDKCVWQNNFYVCSDRKNFHLINKVINIVDFISYEADGSIGIEGNLDDIPAVSTEPLLYALDPDYWDPNIEIPQQYKIKKKSEKHLIVLTSFANQKIRTNHKKDIKGVRAMQKAIDQLIGENYSIQHIHVSNVPSKDLRYIQAQSDIIIDQLNYGRYGAFAREGMMLGKPVICKIDYLSDSINNSALKECPIIRADEESIYTVLKKIINLPEKTRQNIGKLSRAYMMKWHSAESCAERFEKIYDRLIERNNKCL